jgi:hypothetical protein
MQNIAVLATESVGSNSPVPRGAATEEFSEREFLNVGELDQVHFEKFRSNADSFL